jgi:hypothetical protein
MRFQTFNATQAAEKLRNAEIRQQCIVVERDARQRRHVRFRWRTHAVVEARYQHALIGRLERRQRPYQAPRRVGNHGRISGVQVIRRTAHHQFNIADALCAARNGGLLKRIHSAGFPQTPIGAQQFRMALAE